MIYLIPFWGFVEDVDIVGGCSGNPYHQRITELLLITKYDLKSAIFYLKFTLFS
jgi:hypothetical protein